MNETPSPLSPSAQALTKSRGLLIAGGILSLIVGFLAISFPLMFSVVIAQVLGAFAFASGVISLFLAIFGKHVAHRILNTVSALIRIGAGLALMIYVSGGVEVLTLILAVFFIIEGIACIAGSFQMRDHRGWIWIFLNGLTALILGGMVYLQWPSNSDFVLGLLYGINSIFAGISLLMLGLTSTRTR